MNESPAALSPVATMNAFFTRQKANDGIEFPLSFPDGSPSPHKIRIRGVDSDEFRKAEADAKRKMFETAAVKAKGETVAYDPMEERFRLLSHLVISWTFDGECTPENVFNFLKEAPQIAEQIDTIAGRRSLFFKNTAKDSTPSPVQNLN